MPAHSPADAKIPVNACVKSFKVVEHQGIVWIWAGDAETAKDEDIPIIAALDKPEFVTTDIVRDLPYDQTYFIENVTDPAHVDISHDGTQGNRKNAQPLEMEVLESSVNGLRGQFRATRNPNQPWRKMDFVAPNFVLYSYSIEERGWSGGLALYSIPLGKGRCRVLARNYRNFMTWKVKLTPRWFDHWFRNKILEEDMQLIVGQYTQIERREQNLNQVYLPLKTCDTFILEYRKWLDKFGSSLPYYQGYSTSKRAGGSGECNQKPVLLDRFSQHTQICSSCNRAYQVTNKLKPTLVGVAIALAGVAIVADASWMQIVTVAAALSVVALAALTQKAKTKFERSYTRS